MKALHLRGHVLPGGTQRDVYVVDGRFTFEAPRKPTTIVERGWIVPGLVDAHAHLALHSPMAGGSSAERVRASARAQLDAGVLLVREPGGPDHASTTVGPAEGLPRTLTGGRFLAPPGGYVPGLAREVSAADLGSAVAEEARASGAWAKVVGDFLGPEGRIVAHWDRKTLVRAAEAAHSEGAKIAIHAMRPDVIEDAIEAGFDSIEHGIGLRRDLIDAMVERNVALVPTLVITDPVRAWLNQEMSSEAFAETSRWLQTQPGVVAAAASAGVAVLAGTDAGMVPHGVIAREVEALLEAGLPPDRALGAASWDARAYLGLPAIEEGAPADLVVYGSDPRSDSNVLARPGLTILDGRISHGPRTRHAAAAAGP